MAPTFNPRGWTPSSPEDIVFLNKFRSHYERGDVVVFKSPRNPGVLFIKRIIGFEGDLVKTLPRCKDDVIEVPEGHVWVEGDSADSFDSSQFGPIPIALIKAQATHIIWPPSRWRRIQSHYPTMRVIKAGRVKVKTRVKRA